KSGPGGCETFRRVRAEVAANQRAARRQPPPSKYRDALTAASTRNPSPPAGRQAASGKGIQGPDQLVEGIEAFEWILRQAAGDHAIHLARYRGIALRRRHRLGIENLR